MPRPAFRHLNCLCASAFLFALSPVPHGWAQTQINLDEARALTYQLVADGQYDSASALARTVLQSDPNDHAALLALAQAEQGAGRMASALSASKAAWRNSHTDAQKYSSSVVAAQALNADGKPLRAQFWLRRAAEHAPNDTFRARAKQGFKYVQNKNPMRVHLRLSVAPSSNINNGSKSDTIEIAGLPFSISGDAQALSGVEYNLGATLSYRLPKIGDWALTASTSFDAKSYSLSSDAQALAPTVSSSDYAFQELDARISARRIDADGKGATNLSFKVGENWYGGSALTKFAGINFGRQIKAGKQSTLAFNLGVERQWRQDTDLRSANVVSASSTWGHRFAGGNSVWVTGYASDTASDSAAIAQQTLGARVRYAPAKPIFAKTSLELSLGYQNKRFDRALPLFDRRVDDTINASATMTFNDLDYFGFAPTAELSASKTSSTVTQYDVEDLGLKLGLRSTF
ncbi:Protein of unknown function [Litoreibacter albidus]|uniref:Surface lipoprotein assembly modifier C-terminal domain-containing protein n=1 Tax=Litoreibacter albidus TaxID=670155 RepID=A0A1H2S4M3_9RHOB|nr:Protein of unknown function [Litoreibacter albidus]